MPVKSHCVSPKSAAIKIKVYSSAESYVTCEKHKYAFIVLCELVLPHFPPINLLLLFMYINDIRIIPRQSVQIQEHLCHQLTLESSGTSWLQACHSGKTPYAYYFLITQLSMPYHI